MEIIEKCRIKHKPVVVATQMLESMLDNPSPSRSDVSDIYTSSYFGVDSTMLSGECANGNYPIESVSTMTKILEVENKDKLNTNLINTATKRAQKIIDNLQQNNIKNIIMKKNNFELICEISSQHLNLNIIVLREYNDEFNSNEYGFVYGTRVYFSKNQVSKMTDKEILEIVCESYKMNAEETMIFNN